jgi:hypothetical protein
MLDFFIVLGDGGQTSLLSWKKRSRTKAHQICPAHSHNCGELAEVLRPMSAVGGAVTPTIGQNRLISRRIQRFGINGQCLPYRK